MITNQTRGDVRRDEVLFYRVSIKAPTMKSGPRCVLGLYSLVLFYSAHEDKRERRKRNTKVVSSSFSRLKLAQP